MHPRNLLLLALSLCLTAGPAMAQDSSSSGSAAAPPPPPAGLPGDFTPGSTVTTGTNGQPLLPEGNPLTGLFTPQPQYVTPQTVTNGAPAVPQNYSENPLGGLFHVMGPDNQPSGGTNNMLNNVLTGQNPYQTPQAQANPNPQPQSQYAVPGFGQPKLEEMKNAGIDFKVNDPNQKKDPNDYDEKIPDPKPAVDDKSKDAKKDTAAKDKDGKDAKDAKDKDKKDDKKDGAKKDDKDKTATDDKDKTADDKDKDKEKEPAKPLGPYNPLKDAVSLMQGGQPQQALEVLAKFLKAKPANAEGHYLAGVAFVALRDYKTAADEYRLVLRLVPATQLAALAVEGLKKIGEPAIPAGAPSTKLPPLRQGK